VAVVGGVDAPQVGPAPAGIFTVTPSLQADGSLAPEIFGDQAIEAGAGAFAVTDHHSSQALGADAAVTWIGGRQAGDTVPILWSGRRRNSACLLEGGLCACASGLVSTLAMAALVLYLAGPRAVLRGPSGRLRCRKRIHASAGLASAGPPGRYRRPYQPVRDSVPLPSLGFDGAEAFYDLRSRSPAGPPLHWSAQRSPVKLADLGLLPTVAVQDTHGLKLYGR